MILTIWDRIFLTNLFPERESFTTAIIVNDVREKIAITQIEIVEFDIKQESNLLIWNQTKDNGKEFKLTDLEIDLVKNCLKKLDEKKELPTNEQGIKLYKKFVK